MLQKPHSQEWLCYENRSLTDFFRSLFSLPPCKRVVYGNTAGPPRRACPTRLVPNFCGTESTRGEWFNGAAQAADHALLADHQHGFKQRRRHGLAHDRDARRIDQEAGLYACLLYTSDAADE